MWIGLKSFPSRCAVSSARFVCMALSRFSYSCLRLIHSHFPVLIVHTTTQVFIVSMRLLAEFVGNVHTLTLRLERRWNVAPLMIFDQLLAAYYWSARQRSGMTSARTYTMPWASEVNYKITDIATKRPYVVVHSEGKKKFFVYIPLNCCRMKLHGVWQVYTKG